MELTVELKIETLETGAVQVTWLDEGKVTFKFVDGDVSICVYESLREAPAAEKGFIHFQTHSCRVPLRPLPMASPYVLLRQAGRNPVRLWIVLGSWSMEDG